MSAECQEPNSDAVWDPLKLAADKRQAAEDAYKAAEEQFLENGVGVNNKTIDLALQWVASGEGGRHGVICDRMVEWLLDKSADVECGTFTGIDALRGLPNLVSVPLENGAVNRLNHSTEPPDHPNGKPLRSAPTQHWYKIGGIGTVPFGPRVLHPGTANTLRTVAKGI